MIRKFIIVSTATALLGTALSSTVLAQDGTTTGTSVPPVPSPTPDPKVCMQTAVDKRDTAIITAIEKYYTTTKTAFETRKNALKTAWGTTDRTQRKTALKAAWDTFKGTWRKASRDLQVGKKTTWRQFNIDRKACGATIRSDDLTTETVDAQL
jgi:hypothetical protein